MPHSPDKWTVGNYSCHGANKSAKVQVCWLTANYVFSWFYILLLKNYFMSTRCFKLPWHFAPDIDSLLWHVHWSDCAQRTWAWSHSSLWGMVIVFECNLSSPSICYWWGIAVKLFSCNATERDESKSVQVMSCCRPATTYILSIVIDGT